ncbi:MAG: hypothetical protein ACKPJJ_28725 [Planctomycetaceae bacterium]
MSGRCAVFGDQFGEPRTGVRGCALLTGSGVGCALLLLPEYGDDACVPKTVGVTRSREAAKGNAKGCCGVC